MLHISDLSFAYSRRKPRVIDHLSMTIGRGGIYGLLGVNGVGKTTLLNLIAGLFTPATGSVSLDGTDTRLRKPAVLADIFFLPENPAFSSMTIKEFIRIYSGFYPKFSHQQMLSYLSDFGLNDRMKLSSISTGQRKKALLSFAIASNTSLLLLDEPTNGLDIPGKSTLRSILASCADDNRTIVISTHQISDIEPLLDHLIIMNGGRIQINTSVSEIVSKLRFIITSSPALLSEALYSRPVFSGNIAILPNDNGSDTCIDLESFFYLCMANPSAIASLFPAS